MFRGKDITMMTRRTALVGLLAGGGTAAGFLPALSAPKRSRAMQLLDPDNRGAISLDDARKTAAALFDRLDRNRNGVLNKRELGGRVTPQEFAATDVDRTGTLSKAEYLAIVERRFKAAHPANDGTLDEKELTSRNGRALLRLLIF
jgi:Ca2+-binding EF-hand superfamily protein